MPVSEERLESLERQVRRQRRWNLGLGAAVVVAGLVGASSPPKAPEVLRAGRFEVVDGEGRTVALVGADAHGGVVAVSRKDGGTVASLDANAIGMGRLRIRNREGDPVAALFADPEGRGRLSVRSNDGEAFVLASISSEDGGSIVTTNGRGEVTSKTP